MRKLEIGAGTSRRAPDWETSDVRALPGVDHVCSATEIHTLGKFDMLFACMVLEHLGRFTHKEALKSWHDALNPGGCLEIVVPDMEHIANVILGPNAEGGIYLAFGDSDDCPEQLHKWGFTLRTLKEALIEAGFAIQTIKKQNNALYAKVTV